MFSLSRAWLVIIQTVYQYLHQEFILLNFFLSYFVGDYLLVYEIPCNSLLSVFCLHSLVVAWDNWFSFSFLIFLFWDYIATRWSDTFWFWEITNNTKQCENGTLLLSWFLYLARGWRTWFVNLRCCSFKGISKRTLFLGFRGWDRRSKVSKGAS